MKAKIPFWILKKDTIEKLKTPEQLQERIDGYDMVFDLIYDPKIKTYLLENLFKFNEMKEKVLYWRSGLFVWKCDGFYYVFSLRSMSDVKTSNTV